MGTSRIVAGQADCERMTTFAYDLSANCTVRGFDSRGRVVEEVQTL